MANAVVRVWRATCSSRYVLSRQLAIVSLVLSSCGGEASSARRVHVVTGLIVDDGHSTSAVIDLRIDAAGAGTTFAWRMAAVPDHALCGESLGWRLDVGGRPAEVPANDPRDVRLRATSGNHPECDPAEYVARCGEPVTLLVMDDDEVLLATLDTTYECLFRLPLL